MLAALLSAALLGYWGVLGCALLSLPSTGPRSCQRLLLAPSAGIVVTMLATFWLSRAGLPVGDFGPTLAVGLLLVSLAVLAWRRPLVPVRHMIPFGLALVAAGFLTGRPMLTFGFDWVSLANDDMANYCLLAQRLLTRGFFTPPDPEAEARGLDLASSYWRYHVVGVRPGVDLLLAWLASVTRLNPQQVYMPCILALHGALVAAVTGLVYRTSRHRPAAILTAWLLAVGALVSLGTLYQLIAQVLGVTLLAGLVALLLGRASSGRSARLVALGAVVGLFGAGLVVGYPEILPFGAVPIAAGWALTLVRRQRGPRARLRVIAPAGLVALVAVNTLFPGAARFFLTQSRHGVTAGVADQTLFPYLLMPSGLAQTAGLQSIVGVAPEPWASLAIVLGAGFLVLAAAVGLRLGWRGEPVALVAATMVAVGIGLYVAGADFGLFKLALFFQPFMMGTLAVGWLRHGRGRVRWAALLLVLAVGNVWVQAEYVSQSRGRGSMAELPDASATRLARAFDQALAAAAPASLDLDTANLVLAKLQALYLARTPATFLARDFFVRSDDRRLYRIPADQTESLAALARLEAAARHRRRPLRFPLLDGAGHDVFSGPAPGATAEAIPGAALALSAGAQSVFNRRSLDPASGPILIRPYRQVANHLVFMHSELGQHYNMSTDRSRIGLFKIEADPLFPGKTMAALGRHLVFLVVNPRTPVRLALEVSASFKGNGTNRLPPAAAIGTERVPLPLVGSGSARVFSPVVTPREIDGRPYLALDMGVDGALIPVPRTGLMNLYGRDVAIDGRRVVAFARDVSLVGDEDYARLAPPRSVSRFPGDLANRALEYSGIYEDGWIAERAGVQLARPAGGGRLAVRGMRLPDPAGVVVADAVVLVDGGEAARQPIATRDFTITVDVPPGPARVRIDLRISTLARLPPPDGRTLGALVRSIGFEP